MVRTRMFRFIRNPKPRITATYPSACCSQNGTIRSSPPSSKDGMFVRKTSTKSPEIIRARGKRLSSTPGPSIATLNWPSTVGSLRRYLAYFCFSLSVTPAPYPQALSVRSWRYVPSARWLWSGLPDNTIVAFHEPPDRWPVQSEHLRDALV
jgi:hypothetical protein